MKLDKQAEQKRINDLKKRKMIIIAVVLSVLAIWAIACVVRTAHPPTPDTLMFAFPMR
jgi:hypothetical protein